MALLTVSGVVLVLAGTRLARLADRLADRTGIGEALAGAVLLGATTSLSGLVVTVFTAYEGKADLAVSNALGGIAAQTAFIALADLAYPRANLEHAAASLPNLLQTLVLVAMLSLVLLAVTGPALQWQEVHLASPLLLLVYLYGLRLTHHTREAPMWHPQATSETRIDVPEEGREETLSSLWLRFLPLAAAVALCGAVVGQAGMSIAGQTGLGESFVGGVATAVVTSLPELVTVFAAVRAGALTLAVGDIVGGNAFDVLFIAAADASFRDGSIYHALGTGPLYLGALALLLASVLAAGMIHRARAGIGFEGIAILVLYVAGVGGLALVERG